MTPHTASSLTSQSPLPEWGNLPEALTDSIWRKTERYDRFSPLAPEKFAPAAASSLALQPSFVPHVTIDASGTLRVILFYFPAKCATAGGDISTLEMYKLIAGPSRKEAAFTKQAYTLDPDKPSCADAIASLRQAFASAFQTDPEGAVDCLVKEVESQLVSGEAAASVFLPYLVRASYAQQNLFLDAVLRASTPEHVARSALILAQGDAGEGVLEVAAGVLEHFGERSWPVLAALAASKDPRCRHFVRAVGCIPAVDPKEKTKALVALAQNPDIETRWLAAAVAEDVSPEAAAAVWRALCADPDEQLRTTAEAQAASLSA